MIFHWPGILAVQRAHGAVRSDAWVASTSENVARAIGGDRDERKMSYGDQHSRDLKLSNLKTMAEPTCAAWTAIWLPVLLSGLLAFGISVGVGTGYVR